MFPDYGRRNLTDRDTDAPTGLNIAQDDGSQDAALLLNLKQGHDLSGPATTRTGPPGLHRKLGSASIPTETLNRLWEEYFVNYHHFLSVLEYETDTKDSVYEGSEFLFWTVMLIAARHFSEDPTVFQRILHPYNELIKETISKPPNNHFVVKALCLICTWPPPVSSTTNDMTFVWSGVMMKFAMQLGLHRPSHPMDFSRTRVQLREEDISDRLKTWAICNLVAQNISTGYGQPPDTVYDATLNALHVSVKYAHIHSRLEIEKLADKVTRTMYSPQQNSLAGMQDDALQLKASIVAQDFANLTTKTDISSGKRMFGYVSVDMTKAIVDLNNLYASAVNLHFRLFVFFSEPSSERYQLDLVELYTAATTFLKATFSCGSDVRYVPNYIYQMMLAAAVALLKLLHSFFAEYMPCEGGEQLFWEAIAAIRQVSVSPNDLPQRLAEVFAQMFKADAERLERERRELGAGNTKNGDLPGSGLTLKRRYRMSMSHVFDSIWRWKDELDGKVRTEKLEAAVRNPTSPKATTHRHSFSNGHASSSMMDPSSTLAEMGSFGGFGGLTLGSTTDHTYANSYEYEVFDPVGWYLDGLFEPPGMGYLDGRS
jgi:hypothetical protein